MALIRKIDTLGVKTLLAKGEFGYDDYIAGGDTGRVYVGTGGTNIPLATLDELGVIYTIATAGQTVVTVPDSTAVIIEVAGVLQEPVTNYTITTGATVTFVTPFIGGEVVTVVDISNILVAISRSPVLGDMLKATYDTTNNGIVDNAELVNGLAVLTAVPNGAVFTDTIYSHPANHPASIITQDTSNRFVTDVEKSVWNGKAEAAVVTTLADGLMIAADKSKLDGITGTNTGDQLVFDGGTA